MSPEQAGQSWQDIDTRSDVYSLGVLLYKLLSGVMPFDQETLTDASPDEMRRIIREDDPLRPSRRIITLNSELISTISASRGTDTRELSLSMQRELDWVVMKALEKDRTRRYESASALAADLQRYLDGEVVLACPPSAVYRLRKYAKRHQILLTTGMLLVTTLLIATGVSVSYAFQANVARGQSEIRSAELVTERDRADEAANLARKNDLVARQVAYAADVRLAAQAWETGDVRQFTDLLDRYANPQDGDDLRGVEWSFLRQLGTAIYETVAESPEGWSCLQHSPDGRFLAAGQPDGVIVAWDAHSYEQLAMFNGHDDFVRHVDFSSDGNRLASIGDDGMIRMWAIPEGNQVLTMKASDGDCRAVHFALDDSILLSCVEGAEIQVWDSGSGDLVRVLDSHGEEFQRFAVSRDGLFCIAGGTGRCLGWNLKTREITLNQYSTGSIRCLEFTFDNQNFAAARSDLAIDFRKHNKSRKFIRHRYKGHEDRQSLSGCYAPMKRTLKDWSFLPMARS
jgi:hypothetical protein